ncbi:response regulator [Pseudomonas fragi]|uniref:response regulator n=1 Tax=Pseudomonas fragi TaxID=296 RepID=UPI0021BF1971|nr:response regulator [Pseudomonas fragi]UXL37069.1 response regulator [Pseudomonas fragi]
MKKLKVVLADDHPIVLLGVREIIERAGEYCIVSDVSNSSSLVDSIEMLAPDVVVTDYNMPGDDTYGDGIQLIEYLIRRYPALKIVVLTMIDNPLIHTRLYELGVWGVVLKNGDLNQILVALKAINQSRIYRAPALNESVVPAVKNKDIACRIDSLTIKEYEVLRSFFSGMSVSDIAIQNNRSIKTISAQKMSAMRKLNVGTDQELSIFCASSGMFF